jgi:hypothetical protein
MQRRRTSRTLLRVLSGFGLAFALVLTALATWSVVDERQGSEAVAEVLDVEQRGARTYLRGRFEDL